MASLAVLVPLKTLTTRMVSRPMVIPTNQQKEKWTLIYKKFLSLPTKPHKPK